MNIRILYFFNRIIFIDEIILFLQENSTGFEICDGPETEISIYKILKSMLHKI